MWAECPTELDTPILVFGFESEDLLAISGMMIFAGLFLFESSVKVFLMTAAFAYLLRWLKRGRPPGALLHLLHRWDILHMPGVLRVGRFAYSPVSGSFDAQAG